MNNKKIKTLIILNFITYIFIGVISISLIYDTFKDLSNFSKFVLVNLPLVLFVCTSFTLASDTFEEFKLIKLEAAIDWVIRIIVYFIVLRYSKNFDSVLIPLLFLSFTLCLNLVIEKRIYIKLSSVKNSKENTKNIEITEKEKCNLKNMTKSVNSGMFLFLIFTGLSLGVVITKNMEGASATSNFSVIVSILVFAVFIYESYINYTGFYLEKQYAKALYKRDMAFACIGYIICLVSAFIKMSHNTYSYILFIGLIFTLPMINSIRKMSQRLKRIKDSMGKEDFLYYLMKKD